MEALNEQQRHDVDARLRRMEADFAARLRALDRPVSDVGSEADGREVGDLVDIAEQTKELRDDTALLEHYRDQLVDVQAARQRMRDGSFGMCADCGKPIPYARLQAYPTAERCASCQQRREHRVAQGQG